MLPRLSSPLILKLIAVAIAGVVCSPASHAEDSVDPAKLHKELDSVLEQQTGPLKAGKEAAIQQLAAAAGNPATAVALWEEAVRMTKFEGAGHESTAFQAWKAGEGELFKDVEVRNALRLYFTWLQITIQRSSGTKIKDLLPAIVNYTKDLTADQMAMAPIEEEIKREETLRRQMELEVNAGKLARGAPRPKGTNIGDVKKLHDSILKQALAGSMYVQWQKFTEWVNLENWEGTPGGFDGIYEKIVLPEMRAQRDPHLLDYWDMMLQKKADEANRSRLAFDVDKYNSIVVPALLWGKYTDMIVLGQKSQAYANMLSLIKKYPAHPDVKDWIAQFKDSLSPKTGPATAAPATVPAPTSTAAPAPAGAPGPAGVASEAAAAR